MMAHFVGSETLCAMHNDDQKMADAVLIIILGDIQRCNLYL